MPRNDEAQRFTVSKAARDAIAEIPVPAWEIAVLIEDKDITVEDGIERLIKVGMTPDAAAKFAQDCVR